MQITWVLEQEVFKDRHQRLADAARQAGHRVLAWYDTWLENNNWPKFEDEHIVFHGSLGNADVVAKNLPWRPGAFCNTSAFACSAWYNDARTWLLHEKWAFSTVKDFVESPDRYLEAIGSPDSFFVRPDSPLKPFSGRVLNRENVSLEALDYGFYYEDIDLPIVIAPIAEVRQEWRFVIMNQKPIAVSSYVADGRTESSSGCDGQVSSFTEELVKSLVPPELVYVLDVCQSDGKLKLLELNPFSGADLYGCDRAAIVAGMEKVLGITS